MQDVCEAARKAVTIPILNAGNHTPETGVKLIESGNADFVLMGRPLIAEPMMANKLMNGKRDEVRPCIRCNEDCIGRIITRLTKISCSVNPAAGFEKRFDIQKKTGPKNIVIVGGGLSACDSALETAMKGKKVAIVEMLDEVAAGDHFINKASLIPMLIQNGVELYTGHKILQIEANGVRAQKKDGSEVFIEADTIVSSFGMIRNRT